MNYTEFLKSKAVQPSLIGLQPGPVSPLAKDFQRAVVSLCLKRGRSAIFAGTGLGKTFMQLEWARQVSKQFGPVLILAPLAVGPQTVAEAAKFGIDGVEFVTEFSGSPIQVTNYEKLARFDSSKYAGVVLDESSILKNFNGATYKLLCESFYQTHYRLACTATPCCPTAINLPTARIQHQGGDCGAIWLLLLSLLVLLKH
jgi:superfamily II DNA or RNA helicase